jgi:hypothetical protein
MTPHTGNAGWDHILVELDEPDVVKAEYDWADHQIDPDKLHKMAEKAHLID